MAGFSKRLKEIVETSGMTVADIARRSGISVSLLYKYQSGTRFPDSKETLERLMDALLLDLTTREELLRDYQIERIGMDIYACFGELKTIIRKLSDTGRTEKLSFQEIMEVPELPRVITGENNLNSVVKYLLRQEMTRPGGNISMMVPLRYEYACEYMAHALESCNPNFGTVTHLFLLKASGNGSAVRYNMGVLRRVLPWMVSLRHYEPMYCYLMDPDDGTAAFPYYILTSQGLLLISGTLHEGIYLDDPEVCRSYRLAFTEVKGRFRSCLDISTRGPESYFTAFHQLQMRLETLVKSDIFAAVPCILPMLPKENALTYLPEEMKLFPEIWDIVEEYYSRSSSYGYVTFFSIPGLRYVLETGDFMEVRGAGIPRIRREDVILAVQRLIEAAESGLVELRVFRESIIPKESSFCLTRYGKELLLFCDVPSRDALSASVAENSLARVVSEYFDKAEIVGDVYSAAESLALTRGELRRFCNSI